MSESPYVFISYAHRDIGMVLPCLTAMRKSGINLWYDEGIEAGSEWPEYIAEKVVHCTKFVLFISKAYLDSQNCKRELNFAISRKKDILSIFMEDVDLTPGMEMQLGTYQSIYANRFGSPEQLHNALSCENYFNPCRTSNAPQSEPAQPAEKTTPPSHTAQPNDSYTPPHSAQSNTSFVQSMTKWALPVKSRGIAALLAFFLGGFGVHKFYLGKILQGVLYLVFCWTYIPSIISFIESIMLLCMSNEQFCRKYNCRTE